VSNVEKPQVERGPVEVPSELQNDSPELLLREVGFHVVDQLTGHHYIGFYTRCPVIEGEIPRTARIGQV